jgi:hypothetical protein
MTYKGVDYTVMPMATPGVWKWQFRIGDEVKTGKTETKLELLAMRRTELRINRELCKINTSRNHCPRFTRASAERPEGARFRLLSRVRSFPHSGPRSADSPWQRKYGQPAAPKPSATCRDEAKGKGREEMNETKRGLASILSIQPFMKNAARIINTQKTFGNRGLSDKTIRALADCDLDFPERLLFMTEKQINSIPGVGKVSALEIKAYRDRFMVGWSGAEGEGEMTAKHWKIQDLSPVSDRQFKIADFRMFVWARLNDRPAPAAGPTW